MTAQHVESVSPAGTALLEPGRSGVVRLLGGPGTGKSSLLLSTAVEHIVAGTDPESVLLLTGSARLRTAARAAITARLLGAGELGVVREPLVRTVHSYAFAVLRLAAQRNGDPPPRLITSAEQDGIIRELLAGDLEDGPNSPVGWPEQLWPALSTAGFATELRDLMARCTERGVDPIALQRLGRAARRPEWLAAGRFAQAYEQIMLLRSAVGMAAPQATVPALGAAELVGAALEALGTDAELLSAERARIKLLLVDDAQHLDPQAALLVRVLAAGAGLTVIAGDPDQSVFGYRGADPVLLRDDTHPAITLTESHRCAPAIASAISGLAQRLPGVGATRALTGNPETDGTVSMRLAASPHAEGALIADALRRAHLVDGVPWSQMAVIVRSVPRAGASLARALTAAGVPVQERATGVPLAHQPAVAAMLTVLSATAAGGLDADGALNLLTGPIGRVDPVTLRQLRRALRRADGSTPPKDFGQLLIEAIDADPDGLSAELLRPLRRLRSVLAAARRSAGDGADPRFTLWQAWHASGLQRRWLAASERGGSAAVQADRDLDAVTALFDVTDQYVNRTAGASLGGLVDHVTRLGAPAGDDTRQDNAVAVLSAHAALGGEWEFVVIAGVQEGLWPNTIPRGGVLGTQHLVDVLDGVAAPADRAVSTRAPLLAEERRLLMAAMGRARTRLLVTAVDSDAGDESLLPSPFCTELAELATEPVPQPPLIAPRVLAPSALVGRLRAVVCAPAGAVDDDSRACAATQLARLAAAGVPGADPAQWHAMTPLSTEEPLWSETDDAVAPVVSLSPSTLQMLTDCPLRWLLERHGGSDGRDVRSTVGSLLHALVADSHKTESQLVNELEKVWSQLPYEAQWYSDNELERHRAMLETFTRWRAETRRELTEVGTEIDVDGVIVEPEDGAPGVRVRGRLDRLERDEAGRLVVVDLKTGKSPVTKDDAQSHAQLAMYQLAVAAGLLSDGDEPGGGRLVYLGKAGAAGATEREQDPMAPATRTEWLESVRQAASATAGPQFLARVNDGCSNCPVRSSCPAQSGEGRS